VSDGTHQLPETSRNALILIAEKLRDGFTGRFRLDCSQGAVSEVRHQQSIKAKDLRDED